LRSELTGEKISATPHEWSDPADGIVDAELLNWISDIQLGANDSESTVVKSYGAYFYSLGFISLADVVDALVPLHNIKPQLIAEVFHELNNEDHVKISLALTRLAASVEATKEVIPPPAPKRGWW